MNEKLEILLEKIEDLGWKVEHECENIYRLNKLSPAGQDFGISIDTEDDPSLFIDNIYQTYSNYDVSSEAYMWLDSTGHGKNGAPYDMKDVYNDMEACQDMVYDLYTEMLVLINSL